MCANLASCGKAVQILPNTAINKFTGSFEATAIVSSGTLSATAEMQRSHSTCTMRFTHPDSLSGMEFVISGGNTMVKYKGMDFAFSQSTVPTDNIARLTAAAIDALLLRDGLTTESSGDNSLLVMGRMDAGTFAAVMNADTGELLKLSIPDKDYEITFQNFRFIQ